ncbi:MAG: 6-hydroxymethylpterin diphosphokinase MptE-like protein [Spirochaetia bacterium]
MEESFFQTNLAIISVRWPILAHRLSCVTPRTISGITSRDGHWILQSHTGQGVHSSYAPTTETQRFVEACQAQSILFLGLGCGYQIYPFIKESRFERLLILDASLDLLRALFEKLSYACILKDPRVELIVPETIQEWNISIEQVYHPLWHGQLINYPLRSLVDEHKDFYQQILRSLADFYDHMSGDLSSQAFFAKNWFRNILRNLYYHNDCVVKPLKKKSKTAYLAGAGPSLEVGIEALFFAQKEGHLILACDAALRPLILQGIYPDYVLSLDAQQAVCRHFVGMEQHSWRLICDLCSPCALAKTYDVQFFSGGHPLGQMTALPQLDTRGGNVGYALLSFAQSQGMKIQATYGFDFAFPQAKPYARGVYVYPEYEQIAQRTAGLEQAILDLVFRYQVLNKMHEHDQIVYQPQVFQIYAQYFKQLHDNPQPQNHQILRFPEQWNGANFVRKYKENLIGFIQEYKHQIPAQQDPISLTIAPLVAYFLKKDLSLEESWLAAVDWSMKFLEPFE